MNRYYIETSKGRVHFSSPDISSLKIIVNPWSPNAELEFQCTNITNHHELTTAIKLLYEADKIFTITTSNGWFMIIQLRDDYYGSPEYKIYSDENDKT